MNTTDAEILELIKKYKKITVIGLSSNPTKPAQKIPLYMRSQGYEVVGVNPSQTEVAGIKCYAKLADVPTEYRKFVDVFRPPKDIPQVVDDVLAAGGVEVLFLQLGIVHPEAEASAEAAGLRVISNRCLYIEHQKILQSK